MARPVAEVEQIAHAAVAEISKYIPVDEAVLFGSYVEGTPTDDSDIDLAIFSPAVDSWDRELWLDVNYAVRKTSGNLVEPHFFGMVAKANARPSNFAGYVLAHGKRIG